MIDRFITQWLPKFPRRQNKQTALLTWWKNQLGHLLLADLTPAVIAESRDKLLSETIVRKQLRSRSTANRYLSALSKNLAIAVNKWGWLDNNPMGKVSKPVEGKGRERFLSKEEKDRLLKECKKSRNSNLFPLVALALITGMRFGELARLRWRDVDFERGLITLYITKNGDSRYIPLTAEACFILKNCPSFGKGSECFIFPASKTTRDQPLISVRDAFKAALKRAGIQDFRFHDLRHTAASYMAGATQGERVLAVSVLNMACRQKFKALFLA